MLLSNSMSFGEAYILNIDGCIHDGWLVLHPKQDLSRDFFVYLLSAPSTHREFESLASGTGVRNLNSEKVRSISIPLPPLAVQKEIVGKVEELMGLVEVVRKGDAKIRELGAKTRAKILDLAIHGKLVEQNPADPPPSAPAATTTHPYPIPPNWKWVSGSTIFEPTETKLPTGDTFDYIDIDAIDNKNHKITIPKRLSCSNAPSRATRGLQAGDTLFSVVRPYLENIALIEEKFKDCIASSGFFVCRSRLYEPKFLYLMMMSPYCVNGLTAYMKGDNSPSIRRDDILSFLYPLPPLAEQRRIVAKVEALLAAVETLTAPR